MEKFPMPQLHEKKKNGEEENQGEILEREDGMREINEPKLSEQARAAIFKFKKTGDSADFCNSSSYDASVNIPEFKEKKSYTERVKWLIDNDLDPFKIDLGIFMGDAEKSISKEEIIEKMAENPKLVISLYDHMTKRDIPFSSKEAKIAIIGMIKHGGKYIVESDDFHRFLRSNDFIKHPDYRKEISDALKEKGFEKIAEDFEDYFKEDYREIK